MASAGFEPANLGTKGQHATPRPPKPPYGDYKGEKTQPLLIDCKQIGHETDTEKAKYMFMSRRKNAGQNNNIKMGNKFLIGVLSSNTEEPTNKNCVNEDI